MGLLNLFNKDKNDAASIKQEGICPNCWGTQEYSGKFIQKAKDKQIDINNHNSTATKAFIEEFVAKHIDGIKLKNDGTCPSCSQQ